MQDSLVHARSRRAPAAGKPRAGAGDSKLARNRASGATCSVLVIRPFARYLERQGCDAAAWLSAHGLTPAALRERDLRLPHDQACALIRQAVVLSGDPAAGVRAARCDEPGDFDVLEYAAAKSPSVGDALHLTVRFIALMHDGLAMELDVAPPLAALRVRRIDDAEHEPAAIEFLFAELLAGSARSLGHRTRPLRVEFAHAGPADRTAYEETFREARFGAADDAMWFNAAALDLPHTAPDRSLLEILTTHADGMLRQLAPPAGFTERARAAIGETLLAGQASAERVARRLAVSLRTLHRRLAEAGTSHGELVDDVRRAQALLHLGGNRFSIGEISFLLGFGHPNAFHKAFKRWTGRTPAQYREEALAGSRR